MQRGWDIQNLFMIKQSRPARRFGPPPDLKTTASPAPRSVSIALTNSIVRFLLEYREMEREPCKLANGQYTRGEGGVRLAAVHTHLEKN